MHTVQVGTSSIEINDFNNLIKNDLFTSRLMSIRDAEQQLIGDLS
jgi:hypothetical protein